MMNNIRQVRRKRLTRSENTYDFSYGWHSLIRESLLQTSWPLSMSVDSEDGEEDIIAARGFKGFLQNCIIHSETVLFEVQFYKMLNNTRQVRRKRLTRSENTYDFSYEWHSLIRESLLQTSWSLSMSVDSEDGEEDIIAARGFKGCVLFLYVLF
ncbi:hypothetical protein JTE90_019023 [Oedothorax gibbosus]|uniref:Uncharacterized protein n=1 Tax=Oedothorax gibbosus TaxID=931172 RepID=A0AAV6UY56_9ARAC|nr:hypothetical protein JTE90_019023 [Oedothorax gibbosus]